MNLKNNLIYALACFFGGGMLLTGCVAEDLDLTENSSTIQYKEPSLVFDLGAAPMSENTPYGSEDHHGEAKEDFIDPSKLRVLFFDLQGNYLMEVAQEHITTIRKNGTKAYRAILPQSYLFPDIEDPSNDFGNGTYRQAPTSVLKDKLLTEGFKVAVLANWPKFIEGVRDYDPVTKDETFGRKNVSTDLDFIYDPSGKAENSHIEYLSHCVFDNVYGYAANWAPNETYVHLPLNGHPGSLGGQMGVYTDWVSYLYQNQRDAERFIRQGQDHSSVDFEGTVTFTYRDNIDMPGKSYGTLTNVGKFQEGNPDSYEYSEFSYTRTVDSYNKYDLENIWRLWNFSAGKSCGFHKNMSTSTRDYWQNRNTNGVIAELNKIYQGDETRQSAFSLVNHKGEAVITTPNTEVQFFESQTPGDGRGFLRVPNGRDGAKITSSDLESKQSNLSRDVDMKTKIMNGAIRIKAYGEGILRIRAKGTDGAKVAVMISNPNDDPKPSTGLSESLVKLFVNENESDNLFFDVTTRDNSYADINGGDPGSDIPTGEFLIDPSSKNYKYVYIVPVDGDVDIYEIEYMRSRHIYDSARNAIMPSDSHPIPMYGMQEFGAIGDYLFPNQTFNLSDESDNKYLEGLVRADGTPLTGATGYKYKDVFLLRSVAKVELRFKRSVFLNHLPEHIMMRVMNRTARCEPLDVVNPTDWIWYGRDGLNDFNGTTTVIPSNAGKFVGAKQEFENIIKYGPLHEEGKSDTRHYYDKTAWFFGAWTWDDRQPGDAPQYFHSTPWTFNGFTSIEANASYNPLNLPSPRIFNPRIDRSDYCRFHHVPDADGYIRYIMYVPEKNIDDTDVKGDLSNRPKVQHIELRFENMNDVMNFDDNDCYRIYFTKYDDKNGKTMRGFLRDGSIRDKDGNIVEYDFDDAESYSQDFLNMLQPVMRNCHYIFTINSINDEHIDVKLSVCGPASRNANFVIK